MYTPESWISFPVTPSNIAMVLSVADEGPTTSPSGIEEFISCNCEYVTASCESVPFARFVILPEVISKVPPIWKSPVTFKFPSWMWLPVKLVSPIKLVETNSTQGFQLPYSLRIYNLSW